MTVLSKVSLIHIIIIKIIGTTAAFEPTPSSEASAGCPYSLQHSSNFSPPFSWHLPSHHFSIFCNDFDLYKNKTFHEPILRSLNPLIGHRISDIPALTSLDFVTVFFLEQVVSLTSNSQQSWRTDWIAS